MLVAAGISTDGYTSTTEVIDPKGEQSWKKESQKYRRTERQIIDPKEEHSSDSWKKESQKDRRTKRQIVDPKEEQSSDSWNHLKQLPTKLDTPVSGYLSPDIPVICGK